MDCLFRTYRTRADMVDTKRYISFCAVYRSSIRYDLLYHCPPEGLDARTETHGFYDLEQYHLSFSLMFIEFNISRYDVDNTCCVPFVMSMLGAASEDKKEYVHLDS